MSITSALNSAISGLTATSRAAEVASTNIANVLTQGYAPRALSQGALGYDLAGVRVNGITRQVDPVILADRRAADGALGYAQTRAEFTQRLESVLGTPDQASSLAGRLAAFEASMLFASNNPENTIALQDVALRANELTQSFNTVSDEIQRQRSQTEGQISQTVDRVNTLLGNIQALNVEIATNSNKDHMSATSLDQRQQQIDELSQLIPVRQISRDNGQVALLTPGGAILLDGQAAQLEFTASNVVAPHMTLSNGLLSGLTINDVAVTPSGPNSPIEGGRLAALFSVRDDLAIDAQTQVDALARNLVERFQDPAIDATRAAGDPGLFTDNGLVFDVTNEPGFASRLALNSAVDPAQGGSVWRIRDGLGALVPGPEGNASLLSDLNTALSGTVALGSGNLGGSARSFAGHIASLSSQVGQSRTTLDQSLSFASTRQSALLNLELESGVDTDAELQQMLLIEQAYAANARMIQTVDDMIQSLLRI
ncbi:MAG: flagellar hook-associated protein FlgK [Roseovarius sp.]